MVSVKVVLTKSDLEEKKFTKEKVENCLDGIKDNYKNLNIDTTVIETSAKKNTGINYKGNEEGNSQTCLKDYLLDLFKKQQEQLDLQQKVSPELNLSESSEPKNKSEIDHNMQNKPSVFEKAAGVAKNHPAISTGAKDTYTNLEIDTTVIETSAENNTGINYKGNEEGNSQTCLEDYLLDLFDEQQEQPDLQQEVSPEFKSSNKSENESEIDHTMQNKPSVFEKAVGVAKKHLAISIGAAVTLATVFVVTPLVIFKNKIIKGVKTISAKIKNKKPVAKKIRTV